MGADADLALFDPDTIIDRAVNPQCTLPPLGTSAVIVSGVPVLLGGELQEGLFPGRPFRAARSNEPLFGAKRHPRGNRISLPNLGKQLHTHNARESYYDFSAVSRCDGQPYSLPVPTRQAALPPLPSTPSPMKGIVFTEFLEMVEQAHGMDVVDALLDLPGLSNDGAYTTVGTYAFEELASMLVKLSEQLDVSMDELLLGYGQHLFSRFAEIFPDIFKDEVDARGLLTKVHDQIHVEVHKLYPEAELPSFTYSNDGDALLMHYDSPRPLARFAEGLIMGCLDHFGESRSVQCELTGEQDATQATFRIE